MRYVAAYLLASLGGKTDPTASDLEKIIGSVGIEAEKDKLQKVIKELKGKNLEELIKEGQEKLASVPAGGGAAVAASGTAGESAAPTAAKKEEKKPEPESESDEDMGFGLFD